VDAGTGRRHRAARPTGPGVFRRPRHPRWNRRVRLHRRALDGAADRIASADRAVVESYADIARPLAGFEPDAVAVVEPGRARLYDGERYANACSVASGSAQEGRLEERVGTVLELVEPRARVSLPPLTGDRQADAGAIVDAYEPAYEALIATALE